MHTGIGTTSSPGCFSQALRWGAPPPKPGKSTLGTCLAQVAQARNMSIGEHRRALALLHNIRNIRICMGKKPVVSVTYENETFT